MNKMELYHKVLELRSQGLSYTQIEEQIKVSRYTIYKWVTGKADPTKLKGLNNCKVTDEEFIEIVKKNFSIASCLFDQGLKPMGANYAGFKKRVKRLQLDTSHFTGQGHLKNKPNPYVSELSIDEAFIKDGLLSSGHLKRKILKYDLKPYECEWCHIKEWRGEPLSLHLDHINGINNDNRLENLRFLCPNCHSQTHSYCGKSKGTY